MFGLFIKKLQVISTICKLFWYNSGRNCLEFSKKMGLTIQKRMFNKVKNRDVICLSLRNGVLFVLVWVTWWHASVGGVGGVLTWVACYYYCYCYY